MPRGYRGVKIMLEKEGDWTKPSWSSYWSSVHKFGVCWTDTRPREGCKTFCERSRCISQFANWQWKVSMLCRVTMNFWWAISTKGRQYRHRCISTNCSHERPGKFNAIVPCLFIICEVNSTTCLNLFIHHSFIHGLFYACRLVPSLRGVWRQRLWVLKIVMRKWSNASIGESINSCSLAQSQSSATCIGGRCYEHRCTSKILWLLLLMRHSVSKWLVGTYCGKCVI